MAFPRAARASRSAMNAARAEGGMRVVFRADASARLGYGHLMRCLCLADVLRARGAECHFLSAELPHELAARVARHGHGVHGLPAWAGRDLAADATADAVASAAVVGALGAAVVIVDHYRLDAAWEAALRRVGVALIAIDDLADRAHDVDLLIDANAGREASDYRGWVPPHCRVLCGPDYALLRAEFAAARAVSLARREHPEPRRVLVSMGGADADNVSATVLDALDALDPGTLPRHCRVTVVLGAGAPWIDALRRRAASAARATEVLVDVENMAALLADCDLAIGAGGVSALERCCLGLPSLVVVVAANQLPGSVALQRWGAATLVMASARLADTLPAEIARMLRPGALAAMAQRAAQRVDGRGSARVAEAVGACAAAQRVRMMDATATLRVREVRAEDLPMLLSWRNDPAISEHMHTRHRITEAEHRAWFERCRADPRRTLLLVERDGQAFGFVQFTRGDAADEAEWGFYIAPGSPRGSGTLLGRVALRHAFERLRLGRVRGEALQGNAASIALHRRLGFAPLQDATPAGEVVRFELSAARWRDGC